MKSAMSLPELEDRKTLVQLLTDAGWEVEDWTAAVNAGVNVQPDLEAQYAGPVFDLRVERNANDGMLILEMVQRDGPVVLSLQLHPKDDLASLVRRIIEVQDELKEDNYTEFVKSLISLCSIVMTETDEGTYRLT